MEKFEKIIEELKEKNSDLTNFRVEFCEIELYLNGELIDQEGISHGYYGAGTIAYFYIPTEKGYISAQWKKSKFYKMKGEEITNELLIELMPFLQEKEETKFIKQTGCSVASAIAGHINRNGGDIYCTA